MDAIQLLIDKAKESPRRVVLPEGSDERIQDAARRLAEKAENAVRNGGAPMEEKKAERARSGGERRGSMWMRMRRGAKQWGAGRLREK